MPRRAGAGKVNNKAQQQRRAREYLVPHDDGTCAPSRQSAKRALRNLSPVGMDCPRADRVLHHDQCVSRQALSHAGTLRSELHYYHLNRRSTAILRNTKSDADLATEIYISSSVMEIFGGFHRERNSAKRISRPLYSAEKDETELPTATVPVHNRSQSLCTASEGFPLEAVAVLKDCGYILGLVGGFQVPMWLPQPRSGACIGKHGLKDRAAGGNVLRSPMAMGGELWCTADEHEECLCRYTGMAMIAHGSGCCARREAVNICSDLSVLPHRFESLNEPTSLQPSSRQLVQKTSASSDSAPLALIEGCRVQPLLECPKTWYRRPRYRFFQMAMDHVVEDMHMKSTMGHERLTAVRNARPSIGGDMEIRLPMSSRRQPQGPRPPQFKVVERAHPI
ncbi:hypothetical protein KC359_g4 [Hortaea werneckii]|nr:hypothetical protein KC359_g4 [Hortaea werneckii]